MPSPVPTSDLTMAMVPPPVVVDASHPAGVRGLDEVVRFAQTFNGYAWGGGPQQLGSRVAPVEDAWSSGRPLPRSLDLLRASLFLFVRAHQHGGGHPMTADEADWVNALLVAIRDGLDDRPGAPSGRRDQG